MIRSNDDSVQNINNDNHGSRINYDSNKYYKDNSKNATILKKAYQL